MAGFCRNCGSPLADGQAFCTKCGTGVAGAMPAAAPPPAAVPPPPVAAATPVAAPPPAYATPPVQAPPPAAAVRSTGVSPLVKILIAVVVLFVVFGACATVAMLYIGHRVHEKARELGSTPTDAERRVSDRELRRMDGCSLLPKSMVSAALKMDVVRAENPSGGDPGCVYDVAGDPADLTAKHMSAMHKGELNKSQQDMMEDFAKGVFRERRQHGAIYKRSSRRGASADVFDRQQCGSIADAIEQGRAGADRASWVGGGAESGRRGV